MSKLEELIDNLWPKSIKFMYLYQLEEKNIITLGRGNIISKEELRNNPGKYPVYSSSSMGDGEIGRYNKYMFDDERITWSIDGGGKFFYRNGLKYSVTNVCGWLKVNDESIITTKYLYYYLINEWGKKEYDYVHKAHPSIIRREYQIAIPSIEVQNEIVRILDNFTELESELESELEARKKQYEYYKSYLLMEEDNFEDKIQLKEIAEYSKNRINANKLNEDTYVGVDNLLQNKMGKTISSCTPKVGNCTKFYKKDILIGNIRPYLKKIWFATQEGGTNGDVLVIHVNSNNIIPEYLYYILSSDKFFDYDNSNSKGAKMPRGNKDAIMKYKFYLPSKEKQLFIVEKLCKFNQLCNDISQGLPAEIEARKKQYEYYRDKLLNFKELKVEK